MKNILTALLILSASAACMAGHGKTTYRPDTVKTTRDSYGRTISTTTTHHNADGSTTKTVRDSQGKTMQTERTSPPTRYQKHGR